MDFRILGPLEVYREGQSLPLGGTKQRALLAILLLHANEVVSSDRLIDEVWGEQVPETAPNALQVRVSNLRKLLEPERAPGAPNRVLVTRTPGYLIQLEPGELDLERFERLVAEGKEALEARQPGRAASALRDAIALWRGPPLTDLAFEPVAQAEAARLEELRAEALEERIAADLELGRHAGLVGELEALVAEHPLRERLRAQLMLALYRSGRQAEALEVYRQTRRVLVDELGIEPSRELQDLHQAVLAQDPSLDLSTPAERAMTRRHVAPGGRPGAGPFVGRERELGQLLEGLEDALSGEGGLFLIGGEPGIGKSRLADELGARARQRGARTLWGRSWEAGGAPAYWPWVQALRSYLRDLGPDTLRARLGDGALDIAQVLPELRQLLPDLPEPPALDPEVARFRLFDSTASFLARAGQAHPLVLVLDDLHAADAPSLLLLEFLAAQLADMRVLIIGAYRDVEVRPGRPLAATLADLGRAGATSRLSLGGLSQADVARFIELSTGLKPPEASAAAVFRETEGNPLFVGEIVRLLASEGRIEQVGIGTPSRLAIPEGVREVIGRRLRQLAEECKHILTLASVLGREFDLNALAGLSELSADDLLDLLDEPIDARLVTEVPGTPGRLRFSHALVRDALYDELPAGRRVRLHRRTGEALERLYGENREPHLTELAHHFLEASPGGDLDKAIHYAGAAGDRAAALLAYEEAVRLYRTALQALERKQTADHEARCELMLALGEAQTSAGDGPAARATFLEAADIARKSELFEHLARAALGYGGRYIWMAARGDRRLVPLLEEALRALGTADSELRTRVLARLAGALRDQPSRERRMAVSQEAVEIARRLGDPKTLGYALDARSTAMTAPDMTKENLANATEFVHLAEEAGDAERAFFGHLYRSIYFLDFGDPAAMRADLDVTTRLAEDLRQPAYRWAVAAVRAMLALFEGRFDAAETLIEEALAVGERAQSWNAVVSYRLQLFTLRWEQGRLEELDGAVRDWAEEYRVSYPVWRCAPAGLHAELGREAEARAAFEELAASDFRDLPFNEEWLLGMSLLTQACAFLGDSGRAAVLYEQLLPFAEKNVVSYIDVTLGSVSRSLGVLAALMRHFDEAERHFDDALEMNERMGARPWAAHTRHDHAEMLLERGEPDDREKARDLLTLALGAYRELGMEVWAERASTLVDELRGLSRRRISARRRSL